MKKRESRHEIFQKDKFFPVPPAKISINLKASGLIALDLQPCSNIKDITLNFKASQSLWSHSIPLPTISMTCIYECLLSKESMPSDSTEERHPSGQAGPYSPLSVRC